MKTLISWLARNNDLKWENNMIRGLNLEGPTFLFHKYFYNDHDRHVLLCSNAHDKEWGEKLKEAISYEFGRRKIEVRNMEISDVIDINEVKQKVQVLLERMKEEEITIFFSPGTSIMQVVWYILHTSLGLNTRLVQTRPARNSRTGRSELLTIDVERTDIPHTLILREERLDKAGEKEDFLITPSLEPVFGRAAKIAETDKVTAVILGETGTGKEVVARYLHKASARRGKPFVAVNCSAFAENLLESRLFGYKKGAFTGADKDTPGLFDRAEGGTIFLDEIGDICPYMQQTLLRVIQEKEIQPVGGQSHRVDVRIIAATNRNLVDLCHQGKFRWDLYYRLAVSEIEVPGLIERGPGEIEQYLDYFLEAKRKQLKKKTLLKPDKEVRQFIRSYPWPGNVRELENMVESWYVFCEETVTMKDIPQRMTSLPADESLKWNDVEKAHIEKVLQLKKGNKRQTWMALGYKSYNTLMNKMRKYRIREQ